MTFAPFPSDPQPSAISDPCGKYVAGRSSKRGRKSGLQGHFVVCVSTETESARPQDEALEISSLQTQDNTSPSNHRLRRDRFGFLIVATFCRPLIFIPILMALRDSHATTPAAGHYTQFVPGLRRAEKSSISVIGIVRTGGERGIRTLDTGFSPYNDLAILPFDTPPGNPGHLHGHSGTK